MAWRAALGLLATFYCVAGFSQPKITSIAPDWIHRGASLDVTIAGEGLGSVTTGGGFDSRITLADKPDAPLKTNPVTDPRPSPAIVTSRLAPR